MSDQNDTIESGLDDITAEVDIMSMAIYLEKMGFFKGRKFLHAYITVLQIVCILSQSLFGYYLWQDVFIDNFGESGNIKGSEDEKTNLRY